MGGWRMALSCPPPETEGAAREIRMGKGAGDKQRHTSVIVSRLMLRYCDCGCAMYGVITVHAKYFRAYSVVVSYIGFVVPGRTAVRDCDWCFCEKSTGCVSQGMPLTAGRVRSQVSRVNEGCVVFSFCLLQLPR